VTFAVLHQDKAGALTFSGARIERKAFQELAASDELLTQAKAAAQALLDSVEAESAKHFDRAREEGFAQGRVEGMVAVMATMEVERRMRELLTAQIAALVDQCVRSILSELGPEEVFKRRVHRMIRGASAGGACKLHVNPGQAHVVHALLAAQTQEAGADLGWLSVVSDEACTRDTLVMETQVGFVDASLDLTLASFGGILSRAVERAATLLQR
jgi:flagellar biosynthesis/type III secretory pathway protein FliH